MFEKCGFSEKNTTGLLSPTDEHGLAPKRRNLTSLLATLAEISTIPTKTDTLGLDSLDFCPQGKEI